ncbi:MAG: hypothetical protein ABSF83_04060 [Nitrososphaerales archaeon]
MMKAKGRPARASSTAVALLSLLLFSAAAALVVLPGLPAAHAGAVSLISSVSSSTCVNPQSVLILPDHPLICQIEVVSGSAIILIFGCLSPEQPCTGSGLEPSVSVTDSQNNAYRFIDQDYGNCGPSVCDLATFAAYASASGTDKITVANSVEADIGGDIYDVARVNISREVSEYGHGVRGEPGFGGLPTQPLPGSFVVASLVTNGTQAFGPDPGFTLIPGQPCTSCGQEGGWQASEYVVSPSGRGQMAGAFAYASNDGWVESLTIFTPNADAATVTCGPPSVAVGAPTRCTATVKGLSPTGTVTWKSNATGTFSQQGSCTLSAGSCSISYTPSAVATRLSITANYTGDSENPSALGNSTISVEKVVSTTSVACSQSHPASGSQVTCTATVAGDSPAGNVTWASSGVNDFSPASTCTLVAGSCSVDYTPSSALSSITIAATYSGDANNTGSSSTSTLSVSSSTTSSSSTTTTSASGVVASTGVGSPTQSTSSSSTGASTASASGLSSTSAPSTSSASPSSSSASGGYVWMVVTIASILVLVGSIGERIRRSGPSALRSAS